MSRGSEPGIPTVSWSHPVGERLDPFAVYFDEHAG